MFRWSLTKITIYIIVLFIAWCALTAQKWLPSMWSKSSPIKFLSRIKMTALGTKTVCLFLNFWNFLRVLFNSSVQNLAQQWYIMHLSMSSRRGVGGGQAGHRAGFWSIALARGRAFELSCCLGGRDIWIFFVPVTTNHFPGWGHYNFTPL